MKSRLVLALIAGVAAAQLQGCSGSPMPTLPPDDVMIDASMQHQIFDYTGAAQTFIVPAGVTRLTVVAHGGHGSGSAGVQTYSPGGFPGRVYAVIPVQPAEKLYVFVAGSGGDGGFNGGGAAGKSTQSYYSGDGGGGASDLRSGGDALKDRILVAAGGGGGGTCDLFCYDAGGDGGGRTGDPGGGSGKSDTGGGGGGTQRKGGAGGAGLGPGAKGDSGSFGAGGTGGNAGASGTGAGFPGGGGGGGYYGGGGGGGAGHDGTSGGGGGGSSYVERGAAKVIMWTGWRESGDGRVILSWSAR